MHRTLLALGVGLALASSAAAFPRGFLWGSAIAAFQTEMGGDPAHDDQNTDWWVWTHDQQNISAGRVSGDQPEAGPAFYDNYRIDVRRGARRGLRSNTLRLSIEWSRIFPASTAGVDASGGVTLAVLQQLDALANQAEVAHYRDVLLRVRRAHLKPFVTLNHFTLPLWLHDPLKARDAFTGSDPNGPYPTGFGPGGWLDDSTVDEFAKYAAYLGWKFGDQVDLWGPVNEPLVVAVNGYLNIPGVIAGNFPPGVFSFTAILKVVTNLVRAQAVAYDALHQWDAVDADRDGGAAQVGLVAQLPDWHPQDPTSADDQVAAQHADYLFNRVYMNATILGDADTNANGTIDPGEHHPELVGKADFVGFNYYLLAKARKLPVAITPVIPLLDFSPTISYRTDHNPTGSPCPSECSDFGWEIYPHGIYEMAAEAGSYGLPVYVTENGIADSDDDQRPRYLVRHLAELDQANTDGVADVRGYFHWSLVDNFEWASGYYPMFGLFTADPLTHRLVPRPSAGYFRRIAKGNAIPPDLLAAFGH